MDANLSTDRAGKCSTSMISLKTEEENPACPLEHACPFDDPVKLNPPPRTALVKNTFTSVRS
jgi:hypothetical protein